MNGRQQSLDFSGVYDGGADILAAEKRRNANLKQARKVNASAEALAQIQAGLETINERLASNNPTAAPQAVQGAALVDRLTNENNLLKIENANLKLQLVQLKQRLGAK